MGYNTVLVVYNDTVDWGEKDPEIGRRIHEAVRGWSVRKHRPGATDIFARFPQGGGASYGQVVSQEHADYSQVVVVGGNTGRPINECEELDWHATNQIAEALKRCGWTVKPPKRKRS